jgi:cyclohexanecarboxylate-CoA ligase
VSQPRADGSRLSAELAEGYEAAGFWTSTTLVDYLQRARIEHPEREAAVSLPALGGERRALTYAQLDAASDRFCAGLQGLGVGPGDAVSAMLSNRLEFAVVIWGILKAGAIYTGIPDAYSTAEATFMVKRAKSKVLVVSDDSGRADNIGLAREALAAAPQLRSLVAVGEAPAGPGWSSYAGLLDTGQPAPVELDPSDLIHLGFTSGTTGEPKGVMNTHQTLDAVCRGWAGHVGAATYGEPLVNLVASPVGHHTGFLWGVLLSAYLGGTALYLDRWKPERALELIGEEGVTFMVGAPTFLQDLVNVLPAAAPAPPSLRLIGVAGAPVPRTLVATGRERLGCFIGPAWGMTEHGLGSATAPGQPLDIVDSTDGTMIGACRLRTVGADGEESAAGVEGDLEMKGPGLFLGYYDRPDFTAESFNGEWFMTGDRAVIAADGSVTIKGRTKDIIIRGGENIPVVDIETAIYKHADVIDVAVIGVADERLGERALALLVLRPGAEPIELAGLVDFLLEGGLSKHFLPERLELVDELPKTASGKIKKAELRKLHPSFDPVWAG